MRLEWVSWNMSQDARASRNEPRDLLSIWPWAIGGSHTSVILQILGSLRLPVDIFLVEKGARSFQLMSWPLRPHPCIYKFMYAFVCLPLSKASNLDLPRCCRRSMKLWFSWWLMLCFSVCNSRYIQLTHFSQAGGCHTECFRTVSEPEKETPLPCFPQLEPAVPLLPAPIGFLLGLFL